jgi:hypothetical protein
VCKDGWIRLTEGASAEVPAYLCAAKLALYVQQVSTVWPRENTEYLQDNQPFLLLLAFNSLTEDEEKKRKGENRKTEKKKGPKLRTLSTASILMGRRPPAAVVVYF